MNVPSYLYENIKFVYGSITQKCLHRLRSNFDTIEKYALKVGRLGWMVLNLFFFATIAKQRIM